MPVSVIVGAKRTPIGSFMGQLASVAAPQLGGIAIQGALAHSGVEATQIEEVIMGQVLPAGVGQSPARQALLAAGLPVSVGALTINKVCGSGLKAVMVADQMIRAGDRVAVVAGGMENMSQAPHALKGSRDGVRMGPATLTDLMVHDGLWDPYSDKHMGVITESCNQKYDLTREQQDQYARQSYERALAAQSAGRFDSEVTPVAVPQRRGADMIINADEEPGRGDPQKLPDLRPAFGAQGTITAGNASSINDGAAAVVVMEQDFAAQHGYKPLARIVAQAQVSQDPQWFSTAPAGAMQAVLQKAGLTSDQIDLFEVNEAFAAVALANQKELAIPADKLNVNGGAVALGHPIGASGARILVTLIHELHRRPQARYGLASLCIGGGEAVAVIIEKI